MTWLPMAISSMAAGQSAISYIGVPAWTYQHDMTMFVLNFTFIAAAPLLAYVILPAYHRLRVSTVYEYLEIRFDVKVRSLTSFMFLMSQGLYLGVVLYAPALILSLISGSSLHLSILVIAGITLTYTVMGGIKAVIWTDLIQFFVALAGLLLTIYFALKGLNGGFASFWQIAKQNGKLHMFDFGLSDSSPFAFWASMIGGFFTTVAFYGANQTIAQRYLTGRSLREEQKAVLFQGIFGLPYALILYGLGPLLFAFYFVHPGLAGGGSNPEHVFPTFVVQHMPIAIAGIVISGIFASAMGTYSAAINSLTTATVYDFYKKYLRPEATPRAYVRASRIITLLWGIYSIVFAMFCKYFGELVTIDLKVINPLWGILLGVFSLGMLTDRATSRGALEGLLLGAVVTYSIIAFGFSSFMWYTPMAWACTFGIGYLSSMRERRFGPLSGDSFATVPDGPSAGVS
jgi:solute:Na+ symporter, SSS family